MPVDLGIALHQIGEEPPQLLRRALGVERESAAARRADRRTNSHVVTPSECSPAWPRGVRNDDGSWLACARTAGSCARQSCTQEPCYVEVVGDWRELAALWHGPRGPVNRDNANGLLRALSPTGPEREGRAMDVLTITQRSGSCRCGQECDLLGQGLSAVVDGDDAGTASHAPINRLAPDNEPHGERRRTPSSCEASR